MRTKKQLIACGLSFSLLFGMIPFNEVSAAKKVSLSTNKLSITKGASKILKVKNTKKKVKWKILSGKTRIALKKKGNAAATIKGRKQGAAKVQAVIGKAKLTCKVTVKSAAKQTSSEPDTRTGTQPTATNNPAITTPPSSGTQAPSSTANPGASAPPAISLTNVPAGANKQDVAAISALIAEQRERGATVSADMSSNEYEWENGKLTAINWDVKNLSGELNVSRCVNLMDLTCRENQLSSLDVSKNTSLKFLQCSENPLSSLDVSTNTALTDLWCGENQLSSLDVSTNTALTTLYCANNQLSSLDVSTNTALITLGCWNNQLSSLDVSKNTALTELDCEKNQLNNLDVSKNTALTELDCEKNQLNNLDVTNNSKLSVLRCDDTVNVIGYHPSAGANEQDVNALRKLIAEQRGRGATVSEDLDSTEYRWKDGKLIEINWYDQNLSGELNVSGCVNLEHLSCLANNLSSLDVSKNTALTVLYCTYNQLSSLDLTNNTALTVLDCANNQLSSLDVSKNTALTDLDCTGNQLSSLDLTNNTGLETLVCDDTVTVTGYNK